MRGGHSAAVVTGCDVSLSSRLRTGCECLRAMDDTAKDNARLRNWDREKVQLRQPMHNPNPHSTRPGEKESLSQSFDIKITVNMK